RTAGGAARLLFRGAGAMPAGRELRRAFAVRAEPAARRAPRPPGAAQSAAGALRRPAPGRGAQRGAVLGNPGTGPVPARPARPGRGQPLAGDRLALRRQPAAGAADAVVDPPGGSPTLAGPARRAGRRAVPFPAWLLLAVPHPLA